MSNPLYNPYASGAQRSTQGQYGLTDTQAGMDPYGASSRLGSGSDLRSSGVSSGLSTNPGGMISSMHPQTAHKAEMESAIDVHIRGAREELRLLSQMVKQKRQQQQQQATDWDRRLTNNPREEMSSRGAGLTSYPSSSSSASLGRWVEHSNKQSGSGSSMDWLSSYQGASACNFYSSSSSSSKAQNVSLSHSSQSSNVFQTSNYGAGGGGSSNTSSERWNARSSKPRLGDYSLFDQPSSSSTTNTSQPKYSLEAATNILQNFGLESEDLERLNDYPDNKLTPENLPFILRDICLRKTKRATAVSGLDVDRRPQTGRGVSGSDHGGASGGGLRWPEESTPNLCQQSKVIDYGHSSKYSGGFGDEVGGGSDSLGSGGGGNESTVMMDGYSSSSHGREPLPKDFGTVKYSGAGSSREQISSISGSRASYGSMLSSGTPQSLDPPKQSQRSEQNSQSTQSPVQKLIKKPKKDEDNRPKSILVKKPASTTTPPPRPTLVRGVNPDRPSLVVLSSEEGGGKAKDQGQGDTGQGQTAGPPLKHTDVPPPPFHIPGIPSSAPPGPIPLMLPPPLPRITVPPPPLMPPTATTVASTLPSPAMMSDYSAVTPRIFPHTCSLCIIECKQMKDWISHQNSSRHIESCRLIRKTYPDWKAETTPAPSPVSRDVQLSPSSSQSSKHRRQATSGSHSHSGSHSQPRSPSPRRHSRLRSPSPRRYTQSRSPRPQRYSQSRSHSPRRYLRPRSPSPGHYSRPRSPRPGRYSRSRSPSPRRYSRPRSPSPRRYSRSCSPSPRRYSRSHSPSPGHYSRSRSPRPRRYSRSRSPRPQLYTWTRSPSPQRFSRSRSPSPWYYHGKALSGSTREEWEMYRARSRSPRSPRLIRRSFSRPPHHSPLHSPYQSPQLSPYQSPQRSAYESPQRSAYESPYQSPHRSAYESPYQSPQRSPYRSPQSSPYYSPRHPPQHSPNLSPHHSPASSSSHLRRSWSRSFERLPSPKSSSRQQKETSAERLAKELLKTSATQSISDRSSLEATEQSRSGPNESSSHSSSEAQFCQPAAVLKLDLLPKSIPCRAVLSSLKSLVKGEIFFQFTEPQQGVVWFEKKEEAEALVKRGFIDIKGDLVEVKTDKFYESPNMIKLEGIPRNVSQRNVHKALRPFGTGKKVVLRDPKEGLGQEGGDDTGTQTLVWFDKREEAEALVNCKNFTISGKPISIITSKDWMSCPGPPIESSTLLHKQDSDRKEETTPAPRSFSGSPHFSPHHSPQRSPHRSHGRSHRRSPYCSPQRSPYCSPQRSPASSTRSRSYERRSSPKPSSHQQKQTSAERLAKKLLKTSAAHSISERSSLEAIVQSLAPALLTELAKMKSSSSSPSSSRGSKGSSSHPSTGQKRSSSPSSSYSSRRESSKSSMDVSFKRPKKENPHHRRPISSHYSSSKSSATTSKHLFSTPNPPTTTPAVTLLHPWYMRNERRALLPTPKMKPLLPLPPPRIKPLLTMPIISPLLRSYMGSRTMGSTTTSTAKVLVYKAKTAATKQTKKPRHGKTVVKVAAKKAAVKGLVSKAKTKGKTVKKPKPKERETKSQESAAVEPKVTEETAETAETIKVEVAETTAPEESKAKPDDSSIALAAAKPSVSKAKTTGKMVKKLLKTAVLQESGPTGTGPEVELKSKEMEITPEPAANKTDDGRPKPGGSRRKTSENQPKSKDTMPKSSDPNPSPKDTSATVAQTEAAPKDSTTPASVVVETAPRHSTTSSTAETTPTSNGVTRATAAAAQHLCFRHPESMRVEGLTFQQIRSRFDIMGYTKMGMITNLPEWDADDAYTQQDLIDLLAEYGYIHREDSLYILPHQRMAFFQMPYWRELVELMRAQSSQPYRLAGSTLIFHIVMEPLNFSQEAAYTYLMGLSNVPAVDTATLKERLVLFGSVTGCYPKSSQEIWEAVTAVGHVKNYLPLLDRVYVEFESAEDMNAVVCWFKESTLLNRYTLHTFKPEHLTAKGLDHTEPHPQSSSSRGRHGERSSPERRDSSGRIRRSSSSGSSPASCMSRHDESPTARRIREENIRESSSSRGRHGEHSSPERRDSSRRRRTSSSGSSPASCRSRHEESPTARRRRESSISRGRHGELSSPERRDSSRHRRRTSSSGSSPASWRSRHDESPTARRRREENVRESSSSRGHHGERSSPERRDSSRRRRRSSSSGSSPASRRSRHDESPTARRRREENVSEGAGFATDDFKEDDLDPLADACPLNLDVLNWEEFVTVDEVGDVGNKASRLPHKSSSSSSDRRRSAKTPSMPVRSSKRKRTEESSTSSSVDKSSRKESTESPKTRSSSSSSSKKVESNQDSSKRRQSVALAEASRRAAHLLKNVLCAGAAEVMIGLDSNEAEFPVKSHNPESDLSTKLIEDVVSKSDHKVSAEAESEAEMETSITQPQVAEEEGVEGTNQAQKDSPPQGKDGQSGAPPSLEPDATEDDLKTDLKKSTEEGDEKPEDNEDQEEKCKILNSLDDQEGTATDDGHLVGQDGGPEDGGHEKQLAESQENQTSHRETYQILDSADDEGKSDQGDGQSGASPSLEPDSTEDDLKTDLEISTEEGDEKPKDNEDQEEKCEILNSLDDQEGTATEDGYLVGQDGGSEDGGSEKQLVESQEDQTSHKETYQILDSADDEGKIDQGDGQSGASSSLEPGAAEDNLITDLKKSTEEGDEKPEDNEDQEENDEVLNSLDEQEGTGTEDGHLVDQETTESERQMEISITQPKVVEKEGVEGTNQAQKDSPPQGKDGQSGASPSRKPDATEDELKTDLNISKEEGDEKPEDDEDQEEKCEILNSLDDQEGTATDAGHLVGQDGGSEDGGSEKQLVESQEAQTSHKETYQILDSADDEGKSDQGDGQSGASPSLEPDSTEDNLITDLKKSTEEGDEKPKDYKDLVENDEILNSLDDQEGTGTEDGHLVDQETTASQRQMEISITQPQEAEKEGVEGTNQAQKDSPPQGKDGQSGASSSLEPGATEDNLITDFKKSTEEGDEKPKDYKDQEDDQEGTATEDDHLMDQDGGSEDVGSENKIAESQEGQTSHEETNQILDSANNEEGKSDNLTDLEKNGGQTKKKRRKRARQLRKRPRPRPQ